MKILFIWEFINFVYLRYIINARHFEITITKVCLDAFSCSKVVFSGKLRGTQKCYSHPWKEWMKKNTKGLCFCILLSMIENPLVPCVVLNIKDYKIT
jgi:hypothetical protein